MATKQISFGIYDIDREATRLSVEDYLYQAREYQVTEYIPEQPSTTASYSDMPRSYTGVTSNQTSDLALKIVIEQENRKRHVERAEKAIRKLGAEQQLLIRERYMNDDDVWDYDVARKIGYSDRHYRRIKSKAIYRLATSLGLIVFKE